MVELLSADAVKVREGATASVEGWGGPPLTAKVTRVEPAGFTKVSALGIEEQRVRTILTLQNAPESVRPARSRVPGVREDHRSTNPPMRCACRSALCSARGQWAVYVVERGRARAVPVEIGQRNAGFAEVLKGLPEGTAVILHPSDRIVDGVRVVRSSAAQ